MPAMSKSAASVARRCVVLELLAQREVLETDAEVPEADREKARVAWCGREADLGVQAEITAEERALLDRPVGSLSEDELDDVHGRGLGAAILLWALGRVESRPTFASAEIANGEHGLLGDGSVAKARAASEGAALRSEAELDEACGAYVRLRGKARETDDPERVFAGIAAHHLTWILDDDMDFDDDLEP
jgi:hypothetical protein